MTRSKKWTAKEKAQIVLEGLRGETSIAELCRRHGFDQSQLYRWREAFLVGYGSLGEPSQGSYSGQPAEKALPYERLVGKLVYQLDP